MHATRRTGHRKNAIIASCGLLLAVTTAACSSGSDESSESLAAATGGKGSLDGKTITFAGFGGDLQKYQTSAWEEPFTTTTGATFANAENSGIAAIRTQVKTGNVKWDVVEDYAFNIAQDCGTLYEPLKGVALDEIQADYVTNECGVPVVKFSNVLVYDPTKFGTAPTKVSDFFDTATFPGKRAIVNDPNSGVLELSLISSGVSADELYPLDLESATSIIKKESDSIEFSASQAVSVQKITSGNVDMAVMPNGRALAAVQENPNLKVVWSEAPTTWDNLAVVKGSKVGPAALQWLGYVGTAKAQADLSTLFPYGIFSKDVTPTLTDEQRQFFPDDPSRSADLLNLDQGYYEKNNADVTAAWTAATAG